MRQHHHPPRQHHTTTNVLQPEQTLRETHQHECDPPRGERDQPSTGHKTILTRHLNNRNTTKPLIINTRLHRLSRRRTPPILLMNRERLTRETPRPCPTFTILVTSQHKHRYRSHTVRLPYLMRKPPKQIPQRVFTSIEPNTVKRHTRCSSPLRPGRVSPVGSIILPRRRSLHRFQYPI